jgi:hypothetical protein
MKRDQTEKKMPAIEDKLEVLPHQTRLLKAPWLFPKRDFFFMVAGYNAGKSFTGVLAAFDLMGRYQGQRIKVGIGGTTIKLLRETMVGDLLKYLNMYGIEYEQNKTEGTIEVGSIRFVLMATENPDTIYAHNFSAFICDELDELPQEKALAAFKAIQERTRVPLPDGREAYSIFLTTAQGYRGTYQIIEEIKERKDPYYLIHASSRDNRFISQRWLARMTSIYNETERLVFIDGQFANLTTGRVYYGYDESKNKLSVEPFKIEPNDLIRVGQDFNTGFSRGCATVVRGGVIHVVKLWDFKEIGHAPRMIRTDYPPNVIKWYPDASGYEIVLGYSKEVKQYDIQCRVGAINPSIVDRIFFVNKLFEMGRMVLWPGCSPLSMALKVRQYDDRGNPEKGKGPTAPDHWADSLEYVVWRIVQEDSEFKALWEATRAERKQITDRVVA